MINHTVIIAEAGVNHNGSMELARRMVLAAADAGVDYLKFQTFRTENIVCPDAAQAQYQQRNTGVSESQFAMLKRLELSYADFLTIRSWCDDAGIRFLSTPFDLESIDFLAGLGMDFMKIPSGEITNLPYLRRIAALRVPVVMSTGMCTMKEIDDALGVLYAGGLTPEKVTLLHCNTEYPTPYPDVNLRAMLTLRLRFATRVGYSDHTPGIEVPVAAVALGASVIEKHFTLDKSLPGPDHAASLDPSELKAMVSAARHIEQALGSPDKFVTDSESKNMAVARKSIVAAADIRAGELFSADNLAVRRPGTGISPMRWDSVIGRPAPRDFKKNELIEL